MCPISCECTLNIVTVIVWHHQLSHWKSRYLWWCNSLLIPIHSIYLLYCVGVWAIANNVIHISQKSLVKFLNKSTSLHTLSLERVQLSDMVSPPWDVYNVASPNCISLYYMYRMWRLFLGISVELSSNSRTSQMWDWGTAVMNSPEEWLKDCGGNRPLKTNCLLHQVNLL